MPRLTNRHYLEIHYHIRSVWLDNPHPLTALSPKEQWDIHRYFMPDEGLSDDDLLTHRRRVTQFEPKTPQRAGRAYAHLLRAIKEEQEFLPVLRPPRKKYQRVEAGELTVRAVMRPVPDAKLLARALIDLAMEYKQRD
jgi:hypothetical protein